MTNVMNCKDRVNYTEWITGVFLSHSAETQRL